MVMINFNSKIARKVLPYFLLNPQAEMYLNEMANKFKVDRGNLTKKLAEWEREGILSKNKIGNLSIYQINKKYPLLAEMKKIAQKSFGLENELKRIFKKIKGLKIAVIFGSYAQDRLGAESDIDLLLVGSHNFLKTQAEIVKLQRQFAREINVIDMTEKEFEKKKNGELLKNVFKSKHIRLI